MLGFNADAARRDAKWSLKGVHKWNKGASTLAGAGREVATRLVYDIVYFLHRLLG